VKKQDNSESTQQVFPKILDEIFFPSFRPFWGELTLSSISYFTLGKNTKFFYLPPKIKFENFEFMLAIRGFKSTRRGIEDKLIKHKISGVFFTCTSRMTLEGLAERLVHPNPKIILRIHTILNIILRLI